MRAITKLGGVLAAAIALAVVAYLVDNLRTESYEAIATVIPRAEVSDVEQQAAVSAMITSGNAPELEQRIDTAESLEGALTEIRAERSNRSVRIIAAAETRQAARSAAQSAADTLFADRQEQRSEDQSDALTTAETNITELDRLLADPDTVDQARSQAETDRAALLVARDALIDSIEFDQLQLAGVAAESDPVTPRPGRTALLAGLVGGTLGLLSLARRRRKDPSTTATPSASSSPSPPANSSNASPAKVTMPKNPKPKKQIDLGDPENTIVPPELPPQTASPTASPPMPPAAKATPLADAGPTLSERLQGDTPGGSSAPPSDVTPRFGRTSASGPRSDAPAEIAAKAAETTQFEKVTASPAAASVTPITASPRPAVSAPTDSPLPDGRLDLVSFHIADIDAAKILLFTDLEDVEQGHQGASRLADDLARRGFSTAHLKLVGSSDSNTFERSRRWLRGGLPDEELARSGADETKSLAVEFERHRGEEIQAAFHKLDQTVDKVIVSSNSVGGRSAQLELARFADGVVIQAESNADTTDAARDFDRAEVTHLATLRLTPRRSGFPLWIAAAGLIALLGAGALAGYLALRDTEDTAAPTNTAPVVEPTTVVTTPNAVTTTPAPNTTAVAIAPGTTTVAGDPLLPPPGTAGTVPPNTAPAAAPEARPTPDLVFNLPDDLPQVQDARRHRGVYSDGVLYLEGEIASAEEGAEFERRAIDILGPDNVINNYVVNPDAPESTDGRVVIADSFVFATGSSTLENADPELLGIGYAVLVRFPDVQVRVNAFTDNRGDEEENLQLSQRRGEAFVQYFVDLGIDPDRFEIVAKGESEPAATNTTAAGRAQNRRLEVQLLGLLGSE